MGTHDEWDDDPDEAGPYCECDAPDPDNCDEPWVPVVCGNCGGRM